MPVNDELGKRMKTYYEAIPKTKLMRRTPVAIRIDGKAFHTFTRGFKKPFDKILMKSMQRTMKYLCENIQGCVLGYTQSDEITLILVDYKKISSCAWFDYEVQKICSVSASMATMAFNRFFNEEYLEWFEPIKEIVDRDAFLHPLQVAYHTAINKGAMFDSRCFNIPKEEVANLIYWRQLDAMRNSVQMLGQYYFSHRELQGASCEKIKTMLKVRTNTTWDNCSVPEKIGSCCIKKPYTIKNTTNNELLVRHRWMIDTDIPVFEGNNREYIEKRIKF